MVDDGASTASSMMAGGAGTPQSKFIAVFDTGVGGADAALSIVETNQFKALTYLSLTFRKANDELLKKHLAAKLKDTAQQTKELSHINGELSGRLQDSQL